MKDKDFSIFDELLFNICYQLAKFWLWITGLFEKEEELRFPYMTELIRKRS